MFVWHGTSSEYLANIVKNGLRPSKEVESNYSDNLAPVHSDKIYITSHFPRWYAERAVEVVGGYPILIEIEISKHAKIYDDEDYLEYLKDGSTSWHKFGVGAVNLRSIKRIVDIYDGRGLAEMTSSHTLARLHFVATNEAFAVSERIYSDCDWIGQEQSK